MRGKDQVRLLVGRNYQNHEVLLDVPYKKYILKRRGIYVSGMIIGQTVYPEEDPNRMCVQFVDDASLADQAHFYTHDQITAIDAIAIDNYATLLELLSEKKDKEAEFIIKRKRYPHRYEQYDYVVRKLEVRNVFEITESGDSP